MLENPPTITSPTTPTVSTGTIISILSIRSRIHVLVFNILFYYIQILRLFDKSIIPKSFNVIVVF